MSDSSQTGGSGRSSRSERVPVSCGECRRRKQKCNQGQPCSNCARRFPAPLCEYIASAQRHSDGPGSNPPSTVASSLLPSAFAGDEHIFVHGVDQALLPPNPAQIHQQQQRSSEYWEDLSGDPVPEPWNGSSRGLSSASFGRGAAPPHHAQLNTCPPSCTFHSETQHTAGMLLARIVALPADYVQQWDPAKTDEVMGWLNRQWTFEASSPGSPNSVIMPPSQSTRQDAELLRIFVNFTSRFKAALDGEPDMNTNAYMKQYVPFCLHSPLLIQTAIYTSACFVNEMEGRLSLIDSTTAVSHKVRSIRMLKEHLQTQGSTTDEAIATVMQLMLNEWYWGNMEDLRAHLSGLREMVRLRGGLANLGLGNLLAKLVIISDIAIALSFEIPPHLQGGAEFEYRDVTAVPFKVCLNTPLVMSLAPFARCAEPLRLHPATAQILDDMRFLTGLVLALPGCPSEKDLQKVQTTSAWIYDRISSLPAETPMMQHHRGSEGMLGPSSAGPSTKRATSGGPHPRRPARHHSPSDKHPPVEFRAQSGPPQLEPTPDLVYQAVRQAALIYTRAIMNRRPLRDPDVCSEEDFLRLWNTVWKVPLRSWKAVLGIFVWVVLSITPASRGTPHGRFVKSLLTVGLKQMGLEDWQVADKNMRGALTLVNWLAG
ncbi:unnamed protein product [Discula destructiva]